MGTRNVCGLVRMLAQAGEQRRRCRERECRHHSRSLAQQLWAHRQSRHIVSRTSELRMRPSQRTLYYTTMLCGADGRARV